MHLAFGKQIAAGVWCRISSESAVLVIFSAEMLGNQNAGWDTKSQISPNLGWALAGEMETRPGMPKRVKIGYPERKRRNQSEPVLHCQVVLVRKVLNSPNPARISGMLLSHLAADSHHFHRPRLALLMFSQSKSISHSVLHVIMMFRAH